jgi:hypothetical protein
MHTEIEREREREREERDNLNSKGFNILQTPPTSSYETSKLFCK